MYKKVFRLVFMLLIAAAVCASCNYRPTACFETSVDPDSIRVLQPVTFNANCTSNGGTFNWEFYGDEDSVDFGPVVTRFFYDTADVEVFLLVANGRRTSSITKIIHVNP